MANEPKKSDKKGPNTRAPDPQEILAGFQSLRADQRNLTSKLGEIEAEQNEHRLVIETLKNVNEDRKCFRLIGGVLTERTVKDVLPVLKSNSEKLTGIIETLNKQIGQKGQEINEYREKYNITFRGAENLKDEEAPTSVAESSSRGNVLVS